MKISFLQAGNGDCIHIESNGHHVIVDSGKECKDLDRLVASIQDARETIDLLIISHYDSDHINGINNILQRMDIEDRKALIKKVWFNATKVGLPRNKKLLSAKDASLFSQLILEANIDWVYELRKGHSENIDTNLSIEILDGGELFHPTGEGKLLGNEKVDWNTSFRELEQYLDDDVVDTSPTNAQSAIVVAKMKDKSILLPGDAIPNKLSKALDDYKKESLLKFDLVKLPHHGSYKNITKDILSKFECSDYVITTNGVQHFHPNKKMMLKLFKWSQKKDDKQLTFHLNYYDELYKELNISKEEKIHYNFECDGQREFEF